MDEELECGQADENQTLQSSVDERVVDEVPRRERFVTREFLLNELRAGVANIMWENRGNRLKWSKGM